MYEVKSPNLTNKDNSMIFENEDCKVLYNLWSEDGSMAFIFENKTDKDLFVDMTQTFFIKNGAAYDYFNNRTFETRTFSTLNYGYSTSATYFDKSGYWPKQYALYKKVVVGGALSTGIQTKESEYICIPANSFKVFSYYKVNPDFFSSCDKKINNPKTKVTLESYNENNSPLKFKNRIAYSFEKSGESLKHIENSFWLSEVRNYSYKEAIEKRKEKAECSGLVSTVNYFKIGGPNQFYKTYTPGL